MATITLRPWSADDLARLQQANAPAMTAHIGGPETDAEVQRRHENYLRFWREGTARMFRIDADGAGVGGIGWWSTSWGGQDVHETGWFVLPAAQGKGAASRALDLLIRDAQEHRTHDLLTAFPSVDNDRSNALCAAAGFVRHARMQFPFRGTELTVNAWVLNLAPAEPAT